MRNLFHGAIAAAMMSIALMFWAQVGVMATALAAGTSSAGSPDRPSLHLRERNSSMKNRKRESCTDPSGTKAGSYLSIQRLEPVY
jgi:hypothetical protein